MQRRISVFGIIFLSLSLLSNACEDHPLPPTPPALVTMEMYYANIKCGIVFELDVLNTGNMTVTEYGMLYSGGADGSGIPFSMMPVVGTNAKIVFDGPFTAGKKTKAGPQICLSDLYYRAYAILSDGSAVYGETLHWQYN